jgi:hypothetical protein
MRFQQYLLLLICPHMTQVREKVQTCVPSQYVLIGLESGDNDKVFRDIVRWHISKYAIAQLEVHGEIFLNP